MPDEDSQNQAQPTPVETPPAQQPTAGPEIPSTATSETTQSQALDNKPSEAILESEPTAPNQTNTDQSIQAPDPAPAVESEVQPPSSISAPASIPPSSVPETLPPKPEVSNSSPVLNTSPPLPNQTPTPSQSPAPTSPGPVTGTARSFLTKALEAIQFRKRAKLEKIVNFAKEKGSITNNQTEKLLRVSDSTAGRYLNSLVKAGRLRVIGEGKARRYEPL